MQLGQMSVLPNGVSNYNYLAITDSAASPGYGTQGAGPNGQEVAIRFKATSSETLQSVEVNVIGDSGNVGSITATLRSDDPTGGSHPTPITSGGVIASSVVSLSAITANLTSSPAPVTSQNEWTKWKFSSGSIVSGNYYWIVWNVTGASSYVTFARTNDPYAADTLNSGNDFKTSWAPASDGPTDICFRITTSVQSVIDTLDYVTYNSLSGTTDMFAQSFKDASAVQIKGIWVPGDPTTVQIRTDSGSDSPSSKVLATASAYYYQESNTLNYYEFNVAVNATANTKYWIVLLGGGMGVADIYRADGQASDYGGTSLHYEKRRTEARPGPSPAIPLGVPKATWSSSSQGATLRSTPTTRSSSTPTYPPTTTSRRED